VNKSRVHFDKDEDVCLVLEQHAEMDWYSVSSLA